MASRTTDRRSPANSLPRLQNLLLRCPNPDLGGADLALRRIDSIVEADRWSKDSNLKERAGQRFDKQDWIQP